MKILQKEAFSAPVQVLDKSIKQTFGPGKEADYDFKSISSGEDNIGHILNKMYAFLQYKTDNVGALQGIFCIDEIEASLHPVAQINLFDFIYNWAKKNHIQVVINTHSLYLIQHIIELQKKISNKDDIVLNMISTAFVSDKNYNIIKNPNYNEAHKELTLKYVDIGEIYKINIICEDEIAEYYLKRIISNQKALKRLEFMHNLNEDIVGNGFTGLKSLLKNGQIIFFDPEVNVSDLSRCRSKFFVLPSLHGMPIEKEIVKYIYDLSGDHEFFKYFAKEKNAFLNEFSHFDIIHLHDIEYITQDNIKKYKKWSNLNKSAFKKYITFYARHNDTKIFLDDIIKCMNDIFIRKGLPMISVEK
ncbi:AAA family ATPase [Anaerovibrio lipolyticus]|uniref:AAA family ATPase n=1 Tax=Anaerovibrio lipolyticus TaxID=82374 RepID=UPI0026F2C858|nr:AAA family ATPase [Anaerovibrio lipolyticus]MBE6105719.1 ATP-binding protein [Anaerovibrio lipolyticus]